MAWERSFCIILIISISLITGCTTNMIRDDGSVASCQSFGLGQYGIPVAMIGHRMCVNNNKKMGYVKFDIDYGITGIFLEDKFEPNFGVLISSVMLGSPADCVGIRRNEYLCKANDEPAIGKEQGNNLLHIDSKETVNVVIKSKDGSERTYNIKKLLPSSKLGCNQ